MVRNIVYCDWLLWLKHVFKIIEKCQLSVFIDLFMNKWMNKMKRLFIELVHEQINEQLIVMILVKKNMVLCGLMDMSVLKFDLNYNNEITIRLLCIKWKKKHWIDGINERNIGCELAENYGRTKLMSSMRSCFWENIWQWVECVVWNIHFDIKWQ